MDDRPVPTMWELEVEVSTCEDTNASHASDFFLELLSLTFEYFKISMVESPKKRRSGGGLRGRVAQRVERQNSRKQKGELLVLVGMSWLAAV